jgi:hypothetical protein
MLGAEQALAHPNQDGQLIAIHLTGTHGPPNLEDVAKASEIDTKLHSVSRKGAGTPLLRDLIIQVWRGAPSSNLPAFSWGPEGCLKRP